ncbi:hypothetical protein B0H14DRAFT_2631791 [Mycena olivaceomarginata]|nr:hypothetical protein B0H14DRAFT_2631791 [Mycena olivaceomarginata]
MRRSNHLTVSQIWLRQKNICKTKHPRPILGQDCEARLIKNIITLSVGVSISPLEYCGVGHIVYLGPVAHVAICKGDPVIPKYHEQRTLRGLDRISSHLDASGKRKRGRTEKENKHLHKKLTKLDAGYERVKPRADEDEDGCAQQSTEPKRRRLSADQRLALGQII